MHWCRKKIVTLHQVYKVGKLWLKVCWTDSFSGKSPVFTLTEGQTPMLFACIFAPKAIGTGIRHFAKVPSLFRSLAIPLLGWIITMAYALFLFSFLNKSKF